MIRTQRRERERERNVIVKEYFSITYDTVSNIYNNFVFFLLLLSLTYPIRKYYYQVANDHLNLVYKQLRTKHLKLTG